jgi:hypothetical protein
VTRFYLKLRAYTDAPFVSLWLCRRDGAAHASLLHGEVPPAAAEELALAAGLPLEREAATVPAGAAVAAQATLFPDVTGET